MLSADELISHHRNRPDYADSPDNSLQLAYGDHKYVKQTYELLRQTDVLKLKVLRQINEDFHLSNNITQALLTSDIVAVLLKHFDNTHNEIREQCSVALVQICSTDLGRNYILEKKHILTLAKLINDSVEKIRSNSYDALLNLTETLKMTEAVLETDLFKRLVDKLLEEKSQDILVKTMKLMKNLLHGSVGTEQALETECVKRLLGLLQSPNQYIREGVATNLAAISFKDRGKKQVVDKGGVAPLCKCLTDPVPEVREAVTLCLCSLSQINPGKNEILGEDSFDKIAKLLEDPSPDIKLNIVQLISNLAEHPHGRQLSKKCLPTLQKLAGVEKSYIDMTINVINWKP